jgi:hypothetical protein
MPFGIHPDARPKYPVRLIADHGVMSFGQSIRQMVRHADQITVGDVPVSDMPYEIQVWDDEDGWKTVKRND